MRRICFKSLYLRLRMLIFLSRHTNLNSYRPSDFIGLIVRSNAAFFCNSDTLVSNHIPSYLLKLSSCSGIILENEWAPRQKKFTAVYAGRSSITVFTRSHHTKLFV